MVLVSEIARDSDSNPLTLAAVQDLPLSLLLYLTSLVPLSVLMFTKLVFPFINAFLFPLRSNPPFASQEMAPCRWKTRRRMRRRARTARLQLSADGSRGC